MEDINFDLLKTPPRQVNPNNRIATPNVSNEFGVKILKKNHGKRRVQIAQSIAKADELLREIDKLKHNNNELQMQLKDFQATAQQVQQLYIKEKLDHEAVKQNYMKLKTEFNKIDEELTNKIMLNDQIKARLIEYEGRPINFNNLVVKYVRLMNKLEGSDVLKYSNDKDLLERLKEYCTEMKLKTGVINSPKKPRIKAMKTNTEETFVQCNLYEETSIKTDSRSCLDNVRIDNQKLANFKFNASITQEVSVQCNIVKTEEAFVQCNLYNDISPLNKIDCNPFSKNITKANKEVSVQCNLIHKMSQYPEPEFEVYPPKAVLKDQQIKCVISTRDKASQYISTMITRHTNTEKSIKKDVQTMYPEPQILPPIDDILNTFSKWSNIRSISPLLESPYRSDCKQSGELLKKFVSIGTCTMLCNIRRKIGFLPSNNTSNIKQELITPSASPTPTSNPSNRISTSSLPKVTANQLDNCILNLFNAPTNSALSQLTSNAFNELWQIFGKMLLSLLQASNAGIANSNQNSSINQQQFLDWLLGLHMNSQSQSTTSTQTQPLEEIVPSPSTSPVCFNESSVLSANVVHPQAHKLIPMKAIPTKNKNNGSITSESVFGNVTPHFTAETILTGQLSSYVPHNLQDRNSLSKDAQSSKIPSNINVDTSTREIKKVSCNNENNRKNKKIPELTFETKTHKNKSKSLKRLLKNTKYRKKSRGKIEASNEIESSNDSRDNNIETAVDFLKLFAPIHSTQNEIISNEENFTEMVNHIPEYKKIAPQKKRDDDYNFIKPYNSMNLKSLHSSKRLDVSGMNSFTKLRKSNTSKSIDNKYRVLFGDSDSEIDNHELDNSYQENLTPKLNSIEFPQLPKSPANISQLQDKRNPEKLRNYNFAANDNKLELSLNSNRENGDQKLILKNFKNTELKTYEGELENESNMLFTKSNNNEENNKSENLANLCEATQIEETHFVANSINKKIGTENDESHCLNAVVTPTSYVEKESLMYLNSLSSTLAEKNLTQIGENVKCLQEQAPKAFDIQNAENRNHTTKNNYICKNKEKINLEQYKVGNVVCWPPVTRSDESVNIYNDKISNSLDCIADKLQQKNVVSQEKEVVTENCNISKSLEFLEINGILHKKQKGQIDVTEAITNSTTTNESDMCMLPEMNKYDIEKTNINYTIKNEDQVNKSTDDKLSLSSIFSDSLSMENELTIDENLTDTESNSEELNNTKLYTDVIHDDNINLSNISNLLNSTLYNEILTESLNPIVDDLLKDDELNTATQEIKSKRGHKRKSDCLAEVFPCKRSQRLKAKKMILEESLNLSKSQIELGKHTKKPKNIGEVIQDKSLLVATKTNSNVKSKDEPIYNDILSETGSLFKMGFFKETLQENAKEEDILKSNNTFLISTSNESVLKPNTNNFSNISENAFSKNTQNVCNETFNVMEHEENAKICDTYPENNYEQADKSKAYFEYSDSPQSPPQSETNDQYELDPILTIPQECSIQYQPQGSNSYIFHILINSYSKEIQTQVLKKSTATQGLKPQQRILNCLEEQLHIYCYNEIDLDLDCTALQLINKLLDISKDYNLLQKALITIAQKAESSNFPEKDLPSIIQEMPPRHLGKCLQRLFPVLKSFVSRKHNFCLELNERIELLLFNIKQNEKLSLQATLNLTQLYLMSCKVQESVQILKHPARIFIGKCLYFYMQKAILMIHELLMWYPTVLPYREDKTYDRSDALIIVIQYILMNTKYNMEKTDLRSRTLLSKLRYEYHFEPYKPSLDDVINILLEKLQNCKFYNLFLAYILLCKRLGIENTKTLILMKHLLPLAQRYYNQALKTTEYDQHIAQLLEIISIILKPFPSNSDIKIYFNEFARFLNGFERQVIQEAAVCAILRLQRFNVELCYNLLCRFQPTYDLSPQTQAMLKTFVYRRPLTFWKSVSLKNATN